MSNFSEMSVADQMAHCEKIGQVLKDNELGDVKVQLYREEVCKLDDKDVQGRTILKVEKSLPSSKKDQAARFNEAVKEHMIEGVDIKVNSSVNVGDQYQTITEVTTLDNIDTPVSIEHTPGTVMMIDFWATWCPPCQRPMQHNQDMLTENAEKWGGNVKIIGLSIDKDAATVTNHITAKGWTSPIHYHRAKSSCSDVYQVRGVPHVLIVDKTGKIVFKGHPANRKDLAKDFNDLLDDKALEGVEGAGGDGEGEEAEDGGKTVTAEDIQKTMDQMTKFKDVGKELQGDLAETAGGMMRNFCVLTLEAAYSPKAGTWTSAYTNHRVLVGPGDKVDACQAKIEEKMGKGSGDQGWDFTLNEQYHKQ